MCHSDIIIGDNLFSWCGKQKDLPLVHDSPAKRQFTSSIDTFNLITSKWERRQTTGSPPNATMNYSCCNIGNDIYYFGGSCDTNDCDHNNLFVLNTTGNKWREIASNDGPIRKYLCGMIPFNINGEDYLLVIGGRGPVPANTPDHSQYILTPADPSKCYTNEIHVMCIATGTSNNNNNNYYYYYYYYYYYQ